MKKRAFTLVELLVVISIIALLLAILLPTLGKARQQARNIICQSNLKQWSIITELYIDDNDQNFLAGINSWQIEENWMTLLKPYYQDLSILKCPTTLKENPGQQIVRNITFYSDEAPIDIHSTWEMVFVSYGINNWILTPKPSDNIGAGLRKLYWRGPRNIAKHRDKVPVFVDAACRAGNPRWRDLPPEHKGEDWRLYAAQHQMKRFCLDRHYGAVNGAFADLSIQRIKLKQLWHLKWYKGYPNNFPEPLWPDWMK